MRNLLFSHSEVTSSKVDRNTGRRIDPGEKFWWADGRITEHFHIRSLDARTVRSRVGHGLDSSMDWIGSEVLSASLFFRRRKRLRLVFLSLKCIFGFHAN